MKPKTTNPDEHRSPAGPGVRLRLLSCHVKNGFANTYVVGPRAGGPAALIDPGHFPAGLLTRIEQAGLEIAAVLITHGHRAHCGGVHTVLSVYRARVYGRGAAAGPGVDRQVRDGQRVAVGGLSFEARALPGHTADCVAYLVDDLLFTGDALSAGTIAGTPHAAARAALVAAIRARVLTLPDRVTILPGHGPPTTVGVERRFNPALQ